MLSSQYSIANQVNDCRLMDITLVNAMQDVLISVGIDKSEYIKQLRITEHTPKYGQIINLLETYYRADNYITFLSSNSWKERNRAYIRLRQRETLIYLIADTQNDIEIDFTFRAPLIKELRGQAMLLLNGERIVQLC